MCMRVSFESPRLFRLPLRPMLTFAVASGAVVRLDALTDMEYGAQVVDTGGVCGKCMLHLFHTFGRLP
jgi:hypothetical protein